MKIRSISIKDDQNILHCDYQNTNYDISVPKHLVFKENQYINSKVISILDDEIIFHAYKDYNKFYEIGKSYLFPILEIHQEKRENTYSTYISFNHDTKSNVYCNSWLKDLESYFQNVAVKYIGDGKWLIDYEKMSCPIFEIGNDYELILINDLGNGFIDAIAPEEVKVKVLKPFNITQSPYIGKAFQYRFNGLDKNGHLEFRQTIRFKDIIDSQALKVIAFDNIRKEYKEKPLFYNRLFSDYDNHNNLWVLSYGNALVEVIENKLNDKEWDHAFLLLEVLEKIETWIIDSGYLVSFSPEKRKEIHRAATNIISSSKITLYAITILTDNHLQLVHKNLSQIFVNETVNEGSFKENIDIISRVFTLSPTFFSSELFQILELIKVNKLKLQTDKTLPLLLKLISLISKVEDSMQKEIYAKVFVSANKRRSYFNNNEGIERCISIVLWLLQINNQDNAIIYYFRLIRHLSHYTVNLQEQEFLTMIALKNICREKIDFFFSIDEINIARENAFVVINQILKNSNHSYNAGLESPPKNIRLKIKYINPIGYVFSHDNAFYLLPHHESKNHLKKDDDVHLDIVAFDSSLNIGLVNISTNQNIYILNQNKVKDQEIKVGAVVTGVIKNIVDYGMFINLGSKDGLLHSTKVSYNDTDLKQLYNIGDEMLVKIDSIEGEKINLNRLSLLKEIAENQKYKENEIVRGKIFRIDEQYGIYLELENGASGFIRPENLCFNDRPMKLVDLFSIGEELEAKTISYKLGTGYELSIKEMFNENPINISVSEGYKYRAKVVFINDLKAQVEKKINIYLSETTLNELYCPKCQLSEYKTPTNVRSYLEFSSDKKNWHCLWCDYRSQIQIITRFIDYPITGYTLVENLDPSITYDELVGKEVFVEVKSISKNKYLEVIIPKESLEKDKLEKSALVSKKLLIEIGFLYENFSYISNEHKDDFLKLCKYYFGFAKIARSYFFSFFNDYDMFVKSFYTSNISDIDSLSVKANTLLNHFGSETLALETFPTLNHIVETLTLIEKLADKSLSTINKLVEKTDSNEDPEFINLTAFIISFIAMPNKTIKEDIFTNIKSILKNNLQLIQEDEFDEETIGLRKKIRKVLKENIENNLIECKGSFEMPVLSRQDLSSIFNLEKKLSETLELPEKNNIMKEIFSIKNKEATKQLKEDVTLAWVKTIAAFANTDGGELIIGVGENKDGDFELLGLEKDLNYYKNIDQLLLSFDNKFEKYFGNELHRLVKLKIVKIDGEKQILHIEVKKSTKPVFVKHKDGEKFYIRRNASTKELSVREFSEYSDIRFKN